MFRYSRVLRSFHVSRAFRNHTIFKAPAKESTRALLKAPSRSTYSTNTFHVKLRENASSLKYALRPSGVALQLTRRRTIATSIIAAVCCFQVYAYLVLDPLGGLLLEFVEDMPDEDEEENSPWFIPFPGTTKEFPSVPYKESDPDWQEIVKFSRDEDLILRARKEVANIVIEGNILFEFSCYSKASLKTCYTLACFTVSLPGFTVGGAGGRAAYLDLSSYWELRRGKCLALSEALLILVLQQSILLSDAKWSEEKDFGRLGAMQ